MSSSKQQSTFARQVVFRDSISLFDEIICAVYKHKGPDEFDAEMTSILSAVKREMNLTGDNSLIHIAVLMYNVHCVMGVREPQLRSAIPVRIRGNASIKYGMFLSIFDKEKNETSNPYLKMDKTIAGRLYKILREKAGLGLESRAVGQLLGHMGLFHVRDQKLVLPETNTISGRSPGTKRKDGEASETRAQKKGRLSTSPSNKAAEPMIDLKKNHSATNDTNAIKPIFSSISTQTEKVKSEPASPRAQIHGNTSSPTREVTELKGELASLKQSIQRLRENAHTSSEDHHKAVAEHSKQQNELQNRLTLLGEEKELLSRSYTAAYDLNAWHSKTITNLKSDILKLEAEQGNLGEKYSTLEARCSTQVMEINALKQHSSTREDKVKELEDDNHKLKQLLDSVAKLAQEGTKTRP